MVACRAKPAPGGPCANLDSLVCAGVDRALVCEGSGAWAAVPCKGAGGCARARGRADECDDTVAAEDDACPKGPPLDYACTADGARALACAEGRFKLWRACRGPDGCRVIDGRNIQCDTSLGLPGDPCAQKGTYACAADHVAMLVCDGAALAPASSCRGPEGCRVERDSHRIDCDDAVAVEGDPCEQARRITCSADHKTELVCTAGQYTKKRECRRTDCRLGGAEHSELFCD